MENIEKPLSPFKSTFMQCLFDQDYSPISWKKRRFAKEYLNTIDSADANLREIIKHTKQLENKLHPGNASDLYSIARNISLLADGVDVRQKTYGDYSKPHHELIDTFYLLDKKAVKAEDAAAKGENALHFQKLQNAAHQYNKIERQYYFTDSKEHTRLNGELSQLVEGLDIGYKTPPHEMPHVPGKQSPGSAATPPHETPHISGEQPSVAQNTVRNMEKEGEGLIQKIEKMSAGKKWAIGGAAAAIAAGGWALHEHNRKKEQSEQEIKR